MRILVQVLLTFLVLTACLSNVVTPQTQALRTKMLKESITRVDQLEKMKVSCNKTNVTNIFADYKRDNRMEILCKAATIAWESKSCHSYFRAIYDNLLGLVRKSRAGHQEPCPVAAGSTISLQNFLTELQRVLQEEFKSQK